MARPKQMQPLQTIRAKILYESEPWPEVKVIDNRRTIPKFLFSRMPQPPSRIDFGDRRRYIYDSSVEEGYPFSTEIDLPPRFWERVRQLAFEFDRNDWPHIGEFYRQYGPLGYAPEPWDWAKAVLGWFRKLTILVMALKEKREAQLREYYPVESFAADATLPLDYWFLYVPKLREQDYVRYITEYAIERPWEIVTFPPPVGRTIPHDLYGALWQEVARSVAHELGKIRLVPISSERGNISFAFYPQGAFHAAFLQWYFEELAGVDLQVCAADDCTNLVPPDRSIYCSDRCMWRMQKKRHRSRKKRPRRAAG